MSGPAAAELLSAITPSSITDLQTTHSTLSCILHPHTGGIVDDTVITRLGPESFYLVTNAACRDKVIAFLTTEIAKLNSPQGKPDWHVLEGQGLVALQGPLSVDLLRSVLSDPGALSLESMFFGQCTEVSLCLDTGPSPPILVSRGGYTGEDGFELSLPPDVTVAVTKALMDSAGPERLKFAGLGARDSLRLEAGMCLYGHDLDDTTTPVEAGLSWIVHQNRRIDGQFHGSEVILQQLKPRKDGGIGVSRRRVGLIIEGAPAREGAKILGDGDNIVGVVTSGCPSPTLRQNIAMGYVQSGFNKAGTELGVLVRGQRRNAKVVKMPFVPSRYWKQPTRIAPI